MAELTEALARLGRDWRELATAAEALKAWRAVARRARGDFRWSLAWASLESTRGWMAKAWGGFIGTARCMGGHGPTSARGRALGDASARTGVNRRCQPRSNTCARCLCPSSSTDWVQIFANLGKITVKDLFIWPCFVFRVWASRGFRLGTGSCSVTKVPVSECLVPRSNCAKTVSNEFGLSSNFSMACSREFGTNLIFGSPGFQFRKTENAVDPWKEVWNSEIEKSEFLQGFMVQGLIWEFFKKQKAKLSYYDLLVIWWTKLCNLIISKICIFPHDFSQLPFMLNLAYLGFIRVWESFSLKVHNKIKESLRRFIINLCSKFSFDVHPFTKFTCDNRLG
jgi:hypothetical protein